MRRVCLVAALTAAFAGYANAQTRTIAFAGGWEAFGGNMPSTGDGTCGVDTRDPVSGRSFLLQYVTSIPGSFQVRVIKQSWSIPRNTDVPVRFQIDSFPIWTAVGIGGEKEVTWNIPIRSMDQFEMQFRRGVALRLQFLGGNEPEWNFNLIGTNSVMTAFVGCLRALNATARPTQPFSQQPTTQPFSQQPPSPPATQPSTVPPAMPVVPVLPKDPPPP